MQTGQTSDVVRARAAELYEIWYSFGGGKPYDFARLETEDSITLRHFSAWMTLAAAVLEREAAIRAEFSNDAKSEPGATRGALAPLPFCLEDVRHVLTWSKGEIEDARRTIERLGPKSAAFDVVCKILNLTSNFGAECMGMDVSHAISGLVEMIDKKTGFAEKVEVTA